jgi:hypothetical protein
MAFVYSLSIVWMGNWELSVHIDIYIFSFFAYEIRIMEWAHIKRTAEH